MGRSTWCGRVLPKISARIGRAVTVNDVKVGFGSIELRGLVVDGAGAAAPVVIPGLRAQVALASLVTGGLQVERVELERPRIDVVRGESGDDNVSSILDKLRGKEGAAPDGRAASRAASTSISCASTRATSG